MNFQAGQQLFGGQVVVANVASNGVVTFAFPQLGTTPNQPYTVSYDPNVTLAVVAAAYEDVKAKLGV